MKLCSQKFSLNQIKALLRKDLLIRLKQPWMLIIQIIWPCIIFSALYLFRNRFEPQYISDCQYPTRQLPTKDNLLPFLHSYVCTIENKCLNTTDYEEILLLQNAPAKPIVDIFQLILSDPNIVEAIQDLPNTTDWLTSILTLVQSPKFNQIQENVSKFVSKFPKLTALLSGSFDITQMFSDSKQFAKLGLILCGYKFPEDNFIRIVRDIVYGEDENLYNQDELDAMPTPYCKNLYKDVSSTRRGKLTWSQIKPIIQGKIIYGPYNNETTDIMKFANTTFDDINNLRIVFEGLHKTLVRLNTDKEFEKSFDELLQLAKSPIIKLVAGDINVDQVSSALTFIKSDKTFADVIRTLFHILQCFAVDRYVPVKSITEFDEVAYDMNRRRQFYAGVWFNNTKGKDIVYELRVDTDNTPVTFENRNRFWFPGPMDSMAEDLKYHRGFVQIKQALDTGIIRYIKNHSLIGTTEAASRTNKDTQMKSNEDDEWEKFLSWEDDDKSEASTEYSTTLSTIIDEKNKTLKTSLQTSGLLNIFGVSTPKNNSHEVNSLLASFEWDEDFDGPTEKTQIDNKNAELKNENTSDSTNIRKKRQLGLFSALFGGGSKKNEDEYKVDEIKVFTKQFPYPGYVKDDFKRGLYLGQAVQMAFFFAIMIQIATCVRYRIWMKESKNTMVMRSMGLKASSEIIAWIITTFIEILIIFLIACLILYVGKILEYTSFIFVLIFLLLFSACTISFCYMCSTIFASASIGSVASAILFLMTFLPYIVIICLDTKLSGFMTFIVNLSLSTAFCYAWEHVMRIELQAAGMSYGQAFKDGLEGQFTYGFCMLIIDTILYTIIGYVIERYYKNDENMYYRVEREDLDPDVGAIIENVTKIYNDDKTAIQNISLTFPKDEITCLLGRNGAGKSTIIKLLTGQITQTNGRVAISQALSDRSEPDKVGFCSQDNVLIPHLTAREHLMMYARIKVKKNFEDEVERTMHSLNFGKYENFQADHLSGGYQRRLCVAIAFIGSPNLVILDEPCSGVDTKARKCVWELVEKLRKGRAVVLATHYLDEAEYMSDKIVIIHDGHVISSHTPETLKNLITKSFILSIKVKLNDPILFEKLIEEFKANLKHYNPIRQNENEIEIEVNYDPIQNNYPALFEKLEEMQRQQKISNISILSNSLDQVFTKLNKKVLTTNGTNCVNNTNGINEPAYEKVDLDKYETQEFHDSISKWELIKSLFKKRFRHFSRNLKLLICVLILPAIFEIIAMSFVQLRPGGEYDNSLNLTRDLYLDTNEFFSMVKPNNFTQHIFDKVHQHCGPIDVDAFECSTFDDSRSAFNWLLETDDIYKMDRYGGYTFNDKSINVWYNNKGYHSMVAWQNDLNSMMLRSEMKDDEYKITGLNHPLKLGERELSASSILQQVSDAGIAFILLIAFSLVVASASVYIVNERVSGEKLQQKLCGVDNLTYWGVAFVWDFLIYLSAVLICVIVLYIYSFPIYVDRSQMNGIVLLLVLFGFAIIPAVHLFEKLFSEASFANMTIFCLNVTIALTTLTIVTMIDILGETENDVWWRNFFNRLFLIFPQHALSDGLIEICKTYILGEVMRRFDIELYKSPVSSDLLARHYIALTLLGVIFLILNCLIESGKSHEVVSKLKALIKSHKSPLHPVELKIVSIQNSLTREDKNSSYAENYALKVDSIWKSYGDEYVVKDVSFHVQTGECFGLLGKNGAGKSTIFKILSGQIFYDSGNITYLNKEISYCPQTIALDPLLTVEEVIAFYSKLRKVKDIQMCVEHLLDAFNLEAYCKVLVKNLSGGNRRKLNVAVCCIGNSSVVLMDEPTADMDPFTRSLVYKVINNLLEEQKCVLLTSHSISEIDKVCQRIAVIKDGQIISCGTPEQLEHKYGGYYNAVVFFDKTDDASEIYKNIIEEFPECSDMQVHSHSIKFAVRIQNVLDEKINSITKENSTSNVTSLSKLYEKLNNFSSQYDLRYALNRCRLAVIFEKILDSNDNKENNAAYDHKGYEQETD